MFTQARKCATTQSCAFCHVTKSLGSSTWAGSVDSAKAIKSDVDVTGGTILVHGPTANNNGPLDFDGTFVMSDGFLVAVGSSGMAQSPSISSTQESLAASYGSTQSAETLLHMETEAGEDILTFVPEKAYQSFVICSPQLEVGTTYVVYSGGTSTGTLADGLYTGGVYTPGTELGSLTLS